MDIPHHVFIDLLWIISLKVEKLDYGSIFSNMPVGLLAPIPIQYNL